MKRLILLCFLVLSYSFIEAQNAYVYIEGIKGIPFNIFSNNKEVPKLGKGYYILTYNEAGEKNIDITFLNSNFEKQQFVVDVQPNSSYGYRLGKTDENRFYLIDIINQGKVIETNSPVNLALSTDKNLINTFQMKEANSIENNIVLEDTPIKVSKREKRREKKQAKSTESDKLEEKNLTSNDTVKDFVINTTKTTNVKDISNAQEAVMGTLPVKIEEPIKQASPSLKKNMACAKVALDTEIKSIIENLQRKGDDEAKLLFVKKRNVSGCFTSKQVYSMAEIFETQYGRFSLIKFVMPLTSDPSNLNTLESLFKYDAYKSKLRKLVEN